HTSFSRDWSSDVCSSDLPIALIALVMVLRGVFEHWRVMVAHETAARVQKRLRRAIYDRIAALGPGAIGRQRSGALISSLIDGVRSEGRRGGNGDRSVVIA